MQFHIYPRRHSLRPERVVPPDPTETPAQRRTAFPLKERYNPLTDSSSGSPSMREERPAFDWDAAVDLYASEVWKQARTGSPSTRDAMEVFQLVWLRLELVTRDGPAPEQLSDWLLQEVDQECSRHPHWVD
jgi:hypothetical protein